MRSELNSQGSSQIEMEGQSGCIESSHLNADSVQIDYCKFNAFSIKPS